MTAIDDALRMYKRKGEIFQNDFDVELCDKAAAELAQLRAELAAKTKAVEEAREKLNDAIELAEEGISYTSPYFVEKWGMADNLAELKKYRDQSRKP